MKKLMIFVLILGGMLAVLPILLAADSGTGGSNVEVQDNYYVPLGLLGVNMDQLQNGTSTASAGWANGNINSNNSCYSEGRSVPYRLFITGGTAGSSHYITLECDWTKSYTHGIDYFTDFDFSEGSAISSAGGSCGSMGAAPPADCQSISGSFPFPDPTDSSNYSSAIPTDFFPSGFDLDGPRYLKFYNAVVDSVSKYYFGGTATDRTFGIKVYFTMTNTGSVGFYFGAHMAQSTPLTWGLGNGSSSVGGAAIHVRAINLDGGGTGSGDFSIQIGSICQPPDPSITYGVDSVCTDSVYTCSAAAGAPSYTWTISGGTILSGQGTNSITYQVTDPYPGNVIISLDVCDDSDGCPGYYCCADDMVSIMIGACCDPPVASCPNDTSVFVCDLSQICLPGFACSDYATVIGGTLNGSEMCFTPVEGSNLITLICTNICGEADTCGTNVNITLNSAPACTVPADTTIFQCSPTAVSLPVSASDIDNNLSGCSIVSGPGSLVGGNWQHTPSGDETINVTIRCTDECGAYCEDSFQVIFNINEAPVCNFPSDQSLAICYDSTISFPISANDADGNLVGCIMTSGVGSFDGSSWTFTTSGTGVYSATFECEDECGETCGSTVNITVTKNSVPVCNIPSDQSFFICNDTTFTFPVSATDVDNNLIGCTMTSGVGSFDGSSWTFTTTGSGVYTATFECQDECGETCGGTVNITVTKNSVPVCNIPLDQSFFICNDTTFTFPVSASDIDNNLIGCTMTSGVGSFDGGNWTFTTTGAGVYTAVFECEDECGETCGSTVNITVTQNSIPVCNIPSNQSFFICNDSTFTFPVSATDTDNNLVGCTMTSGPGSFDGSNWTFTTTGSGVYTAIFECEDECGEICGGTVNITVTKNSVPVCNIPSDQSFFICDDTTFTFPVSASDVDNNLTGCTMTSGPGSFDGSNWTFMTTGSGVYTATFECEDECGETCGGTVNITVTRNSVPVCNIPLDQSFFICNDTTFTFPVSASDIDNNLIGCTMTSGVGSFDGGNWTFTTTGAGVYTAVFECEDECGETCGSTVNITVTQNSIPVCNIPSNQSFFICNDSTFTFPVSATDTDNNLVGCTMTSGPGSFDGSNWTFTTTGAGVYTAVFECEDECGETCGSTVNITVTQNSIPVCNIPSNQSFFICNDSTFTFPVSVTDTDNNLVGCTMTSGPGSFDGGNWTFTTTGSGVYTAIFECEDECGETCGGTVNITVTKNSIPVCNIPSDQSFFICDDTTFTFPVSASDIDNNLIGCTMTSGVGSFDGGNWTFMTTGSGVYTAVFECEDECGETCGGTVNITVTKNSVPVCNIPSDQSFFICSDSSFTFPISATDTDNNLTGCTMTSGPGSFDGSNWTFTTTGSGVYSATFECQDECGETCGRTVNITVTRNSVPVCNIPSDQSFFICDDTTFTFPVSATDVDNNLTGCTMTSGPGSFDGSNWTFTTTGAGVYTAVFECEDECGETCGGTVNITVTKNSIPVCNIPIDQSFFICNDSTFTFPVSASDVDNNLVGCTMTSGPGSFDGSNWTFTTTGSGVYSAIFECEDECGETCGGTVNITVTKNSVPVCNIPSDQSFFICDDTTFTFPVSASDIDNNLIGCTMTSGVGSFDGSNWTFTTTGAGVYTAVFECEDECGETCGGTVNITVTKNSVPVCNIPSDQSFFICNDTTFTFPVSASDIDNNLIGCTMTSGVGSFDGSNWTFTTNGSGVYTATFECEDECGETCGGTVNITVTKNSIPVCNIPFDQSFFICNDTTFTFPVFATDVDNNLTGCTMTSGPGSFDGSSWTFTTTGSGVYTATFECQDECGETCGGTVNITVTKNSVPVCNIPSDQSFFICDDTTFTFPVSASDIDNNLTGCTMTSGPGSFDGSNWTFTTTGSGVYTAIFEYEDECGETCGGTVNITVTRNSVPVCNIPSDQSFFICSDTIFTFPISATDVDNNLTGCTMTSGPGSFDGSNWTFATTGSGVYTATFECEDECGETCGGTVNITVTKNSVPVCDIPSDQSFFICSDTIFTFPVSASDIDNNLTGCTMTSGPGSFDGSSWTFTTTGSGVYSATFECQDECGETCGRTVNITVTKNSVPVCNIPSDQSFFICNDSSFTFPISATDTDNNLVGCTMTSGPGSFDGSNWTFTTTGSGVYTAIFECEDECTETCGGTVNITVTKNSVPVCDIPSNQSFFVCDDTTFIFPVSASDTDNNLTGCTMTSGPGSFDGSNWTFTTTGAGVYTAVFECEDECGETCGGTVNITVTKNSVPVCNIPSDQSFFICSDTIFTFPISATDVDNNLTGCTMTSGPGSFDGSNWTFATTGSGVYTATFECEDECGETCGGTVNITVTKNSVPVCNIPSDQSFFICSDTIFTFPVSASDIDNNLTGCTMTSGPGSFDGSNWTFTANGSGVYTATFECEDECGETCGGTVNITVTRNSVPVCNIPSDQSFFICNDSTFTFPISATDVDNNLAGCTMTSGPGSYNGSSWTFTTSDAGIYSAGFECEDECGETCAGTVTITVTMNSAPICDVPDDFEMFICADTTLDIVISASDPDYNLSGCSLISGPGVLNGSVWSVTTSGTGVYTGIFQCEDECGEVCVDTLNVTISGNTAPVCDLPDNATYFVCSDTAFSFTISADDFEDNLVGCTMTSGPGSFDGSTWTFAGTNPGGVYSAVFECVDACGAVCGDTVDITVVYNTAAPVCAVPNDTAIFQCEATEVCLPVTAGDVDDNLVGCEIIAGPGSLESGYWCYTPIADDVVEVTIQCTDICGLTCESSFNVAFEVNSPPYVEVPDDTTILQKCTPSEVCLRLYYEDDENNITTIEIINGPGQIVGDDWCYTPLNADPIEVVDVLIRWTDECGAYTDAGFQVIFEVPMYFAVINLDRSGSMFIANPLGESRLERAKLIAHEEVDKLLDSVDADFPGMYWISVMAFNASEFSFLQDFTSDPALIHAAINAVTNPKHDTPLAAALCEANCLLPACEHYIFTYTNGAENVSHNYDLCGACDSCDQYIASGWDSECDPYNPGGCTEWQMCLYDTYVSNAHHCIHYFDLPENPFEKAEEPFEDLLYLKALGEESDGCFYYYSDAYAEEMLCGDANNDWTVNVSDAVYVINYVFAGGPAPDPMLAGDANCDGMVNVSDAVWIINYVFTGGFAPCDTDGDGEPDC